VIGLLTNPDEREIAAEFFELFKTPWEFSRSGERYDVVVSTRDEDCGGDAELVLRYGSARSVFDASNNIRVTPLPGKTGFLFGGRRVPLYQAAATFSENALCLPVEGSEKESLTFAAKTGQGVVVRLGYNLFDEIRYLLTQGQPAANASSPTLDLHIALMKELITRSGQSVIEIPPVPEGYAFSACLTHDVDHPALKNHFLDHTMFGFLGRATVGSFVEVCQGRKSLGKLGQNLWSACRLPFVYLGLASDPWRGFDRYLQLESAPCSTFFVIPKKGDAGKQRIGRAPAMRAAGYSLDEIQPELKRITSSGGEVALHGLDSWLDAADGQAEQDILSQANVKASRGVRMHWLFFDEHSCKALDQAGFSYDSTFGYNETVGFRAGTAQAYKPPGVAALIELPLHVMDTALFYPGYLNLPEDKARKLIWQVLDNVELFGGALMINWHDRSIAPERLWDDFYLMLVNELKLRRVWLPTASCAASWFRKRRSVKFESVRGEGKTSKYRATFQQDQNTPGLKVRIHRPQTQGFFDRTPVNISNNYQESVLQADMEITTAIAA
jgi:hypothetical protein